MADLPIDLGNGLDERLAGILDVEGKIPRTLDALGQVGGRDVLLLDGTDGIRARQLTELGGTGRLREDGRTEGGFEAPEGLGRCPGQPVDVVP